MRKTFTTNLPTWEKGTNKGKINWDKTTGYKVKFKYDDIEGEVEIISYYKKKQKLDIKYKNKIFNIAISSLQNCNLGVVLGIQVREYRYQINDIITDIKFGKLKILNKFYKLVNENSNKKNEYRKAYKYKCLICGNEDIIYEYDLISKHIGCSVCSGNKILKGYNDLTIINPYLASLFANKEDTYKYTQNSNQYVDFICPDCGNVIKHKLISSININGLSCPNCSDKLPYTEKFTFNVLKQLLGDNFIYQLTKSTLKWCKNYRYDFYFKINNEEYIIETHGLQHYQETGGYHTNAEEEQENDKNKKELALQNDIKKENYIVIDCSYSTLEWIKEHILFSKLAKLFDLSKIDWLECHKFACSSIIKQACELWNSGIHSTKEIGKIMKLHSATITRYLKQGTKLEWCDYDPKKSIEREVICLNSNQVFNSFIKAEEIYKVERTNINICCRNKTKYAGVDQKTGEYLQWQYYDEYLIKPKKLLTNEEIYNLKNDIKKRKIICLNSNKIFKAIDDAINYYNLKSNHITDCCKGRRKYSGIDPITKEKLQWMYYEDYLKLNNK